MFRPSPSPLYSSYSSTIFSNAQSGLDNVNFEYQQQQEQQQQLILLQQQQQQQSSVVGNIARHDSGGPGLLTDPVFNIGGVGLGASAASSPLNFTSPNRLTSRQHLHLSGVNSTDNSNNINDNRINIDTISNNLGTIPNSSMDEMDGHGFEAQQQAASQYEPALKGPLVGQKRSSHAITEEYARADPIYVAKTVALPQTYSHYRPIIGDGNCGWRAIVFNYFEMLQKIGNASQIESEIARMQNMGPVLTSALNLDSMIFESMQEVVIELLEEILNTLHLGPFNDSNSVILQRFNEKQESDSIVYWFRLLASSCLVLNSDEYVGFLPGGVTLDEYRQSTLMPTYAEIDDLGMLLLLDVLLKPLRIATEVVILDRSVGNQVNTHVFQELDKNNNPVHLDAPRIYLLYRPGHYDILYKDPLPQQPEISQAPLQVLRVHDIGFQDESWLPAPSFDASPYDLNLLTKIPGLSLLPQSQSTHGFSALDGFKLQSNPYDMSPSNTFAMNSPGATHYSNSPTSPLDGGVFPSVPLPVHPLPQSHSPRSANPMAPPLQNHMASPPPSISSMQQSATRQSLHSPHSLQSMQRQNSFPAPQSPFPGSTLSSSPHPISSLPQPQQDRSSQIIRQSKYNFEAEYQQPPPPPLTNPFRESNFNPAHYRNEVFQPEQWQPTYEDGGGGGNEKVSSERTSRGKGSGNRSSGEKGGHRTGRRRSD